MSQVNIKYSGATPGADSAVYVLFNSTLLGMGGGAIQNMPGGNKRYLLRLSNSQSGTLRCYASNNGGTSWTQVVPDTAWTASAAGDQNNLDFLIAGYKDFKAEWTNGGSAQATWVVHQALLCDQVKVT